MSVDFYNYDELERFRVAQRLGYEGALQVASLLKLGMTERQAAHLLDQFLRGRGVSGFFHTSFAWFGERTQFKGFSSPFDFLPTNKKLEIGMAVILDTAPVLNGFTSDIAYSFVFGEKSINSKLSRALQELRSLIPKWINEGMSIRKVYRMTDGYIRDHRLENCHQKYPFRVLGHKVGKVVHQRFLPSIKLGGIQLETFAYVVGSSLDAIWRKTENKFPFFWNETADSLPEPGLWAMEPHLGIEGVGAKWEELLLITESGAHWLDHELPHVRA